jgi:hypothetical protein
MIDNFPRFAASLKASFFSAQDELLREFARTHREGERGQVDVEFEGYEIVVFIATNCGRRLERRVQICALGSIH